MQKSRNSIIKVYTIFLIMLLVVYYLKMLLGKYISLYKVWQ